MCHRLLIQETKLKYRLLIILPSISNPFLLIILPYISILRSVLEILFLQPLLFLFTRWDIDSFYFKYNGSCPIIATSNQHTLVICPAMHDVSILQSCIDISAHCVSCLTAKLAIHQMVKIILLWCSLQ